MRIWKNGCSLNKAVRNSPDHAKPSRKWRRKIAKLTQSKCWWRWTLIRQLIWSQLNMGKQSDNRINQTNWSTQTHMDNWTKSTKLIRVCNDQQGSCPLWQVESDRGFYKLPKLLAKSILIPRTPSHNKSNNKLGPPFPYRISIDLRSALLSRKRTTQSVHISTTRSTSKSQASSRIRKSREMSRTHSQA